MNGVYRLRREDIEDSLMLSEFAFQYELSEEERKEKAARVNLDEQWGYYADGKLAAKLTLFSMHTWLHGKKFAMGGLASIATWPEYRRKGIVGDLLANALEKMRDNGQTLSFLHPFSFPFYRRYGWETCTEYKKYELTVDQLTSLPHSEGTVRRTGDWRLLNSIYESFAIRYNGALVRDEAWWTERIFNRKKGHSAVYTDRNGAPRGYIRYEVKNREMDISEFVQLDEQARSALWKFIGNHDSMIDMVKLNAPADDGLPFLLPNPRIKQEVVPYFMARVVDAPAFLARFPFAPGQKSRSFVLHLEDLHAAWNRGSFAVRVDEGGSAAVRRLGSSPVEDFHREGSEPLPEGVSCDVQTLAAMMMGYRRPRQLREIGRLQGSEAEVAVLEELLPARTPYLPDYF